MLLQMATEERHQYLMDIILDWTWWKREIIPTPNRKSIFGLSYVRELFM
jgi:hypothetical protein